MVFAGSFVSADTAYAQTQTFCAGNSTLNVTTDVYVFNGTSTERTVTTQNVTCADGCSVFMSDCRGSQFEQLLLAIGLIALLIAVLIIAVYLSRDIPHLEVAVSILLGLSSVIIGLTDTFSGTYEYVFYGFGVLFIVIAPVIFFVRRGSE